MEGPLLARVRSRGFVLLVWGYGLAQRDPVVLWAAPVWARHLSAALMLLALVLLTASQVPRNHVKAALHHPMVLSVKVWAFAHLLANNTLADLVLFGSFLLWAVLDFRSARRRDRAHGTAYAPGTAKGTAITIVAGVAVWALFAFWAHGLLFGVRPMGWAPHAPPVAAAIGGGATSWMPVRCGVPKGHDCMRGICCARAGRP